MRFTNWYLVAACLLAWPAGALAQEKNEKLARQAAEEFLKAVKAEDLDATMKAVDVPFFMDGQRNIKDRDELRKEFASIYDKKDLTQIAFEVKEVHAFEKFQDKFSEKDRELLKEVAGKGDFIVHVEIATPGKKEAVALVVRLRDGKAKVAGLRD